MWFDAAFSFEATDPCRIHLQKIITVKADESYSINASGKIESTWVAVRTIAGEGLLSLKDKTTWHLPAHSLLVIAWEQIAHFQTHGRKWHFWWFEFSDEGPMPLPHGKLLTPAPQKNEKQLLNQCFGLMKTGLSGKSSIANALFSLLFYFWADESGLNHKRVTRYEKIVQRSITLMLRDLHSGVNIEHWAQELGIGSKRFHQIFLIHTGLPPKRYYNELRLQRAFDLMSKGGLTISETADQLGFSSPFHLSLAFKKRFGASPRKHIK